MIKGRGRNRRGPVCIFLQRLRLTHLERALTSSLQSSADTHCFLLLSLHSGRCLFPVRIVSNHRFFCCVFLLFFSILVSKSNAVRFSFGFGLFLTGEEILAR